MWKLQIQKEKKKKKKKEIIENARSACLYKKKKNEPGRPKVLNNQTWQSNNN